MPMPPSPLVRLGAFRDQLHACFPRRADALFELGDALLCAEVFPSLPHLSLEPAHRRGWGSAYAALARGRIDTERLRDLLVGCLPPADPLVFAVDVTTWPRCDAECSPERGYYYHPSRHSAGQLIIAGWAFQWITQLSLDRDSWTAPVDARRLHPLDDTDRTAAAQVRALLARLPAGGPVPWLVFDAGYDSAQLTLDLAEAPVAVLVRLRADRCFYADPPPRAPGNTGRPRRHGAKFNCADPTTWPVPTATLTRQDDQYGTVTVAAWAIPSGVGGMIQVDERTEQRSCPTSRNAGRHARLPTWVELVSAATSSLDQRLRPSRLAPVSIPRQPERLATCYLLPASPMPSADHSSRPAPPSVLRSACAGRLHPWSSPAPDRFAAPSGIAASGPPGLPLARPEIPATG